jgi:hypothetical protein
VHQSAITGTTRLVSRSRDSSTSSVAASIEVASASSASRRWARSASARAARSAARCSSRSCSACTRTVTSAWMPTKWVSRPCASYTGEMDSSFQKAEPSLR